MKPSRDISFHPKFAAALDVFFSVIMFWWLSHIGAWWLLIAWFGLRVLLWAGLIRFVHYPPEIKRLRHLLSLLLFVIGNLFFLIFIEWTPAWILLSAMATAISAGSFWLLPSVSNELSFFLKPQRRSRLFLALFGIAGVWSGVFACVDFQIISYASSWFWLGIASVVAALVAGWWWYEYGVLMNRRFWIWVLAWFLVLFELSVAIKYLPIGFLVGGFFLTWVWYSLWLLARFELSDRGIDWQKHKYPAIINFIAIAIYLLIIVRFY